MNVVEVKRVRIGEGATKICVPMVAPTDYDVDAQIRTIKRSKTDLVEFRADCFEDCLDMDILTRRWKRFRISYLSSRSFSHFVPEVKAAVMILHRISTGKCFCM